MARVDYDKHQHQVFSRARAVMPENARLWSGIFRRWMGDARLVADVGAGVGLYSTVLAEALPDARVIAVEPSAGMRAAGEREHGHPRVDYVGGRAEELPLDDGRIDSVLLSNVLHHVDDRGATAAEVARVLRPGGTLMIRGSLRDVMRENPHWRHFPEALAIAERDMPTVADVIELFESAGLHVATTEVVEQPTAPDLRTFADKIALRAISALELLDDDLFERGLASLRAAAEAEAEPRPVIERLDLLVFRRR